MTGECSACLGDGLEIHEHHLVPRALGGGRGPTAPLCSNCHALVHKAARDASTLEDLPDRDHRFRIAQMAAIILRAEKVVKSDPNRSVSIQDRVPAEVHGKLKELAALYGTSIKEAMRTAVRQEHARWFGHGRSLRDRGGKTAG